MSPHLPVHLLLAALALDALAVTNLRAQCSPLQPASFLQSTTRCDPNSNDPTYETSGAVWHPVRRQLLVVGDEGDVVAFDPDTLAIQQAWCLSGDPDLEGICYVDPCSDLVYLLEESAVAIWEFDLASGRVLRRFNLPFAAYEALTFVPDPTTAHGGYFYAGVQTTGRIDVWELPLRTPGATTSRLVRRLEVPPPPGVFDTDLRDFEYDRDADVLYAISRTNHLILALDRDGNRLACWNLERAAAHEALAVRGCRLYSGVDNGSSWFFEVHDGFPDALACRSFAASTTTMAAGQGATIPLTLDPGAAFAHQAYVLLGSLSGNAPGVTVGGVHLPLRVDAYTELLLVAPNPTGSFALRNVGLLDAAGRATPVWTLPPLPPFFVGLTWHHAAVFVDAQGQITDASNSEPLCVL